MSDNEPDPIAGALRDLLQSEGWRIFKQAADEQWGAVGYGREMQRALSTVPHGPERHYELARVAEQVEATAQALHRILSWPAEEIKRRTQGERAPAVSVRDRLRQSLGVTR